jgi:hypothetical protein
MYTTWNTHTPIYLAIKLGQSTFHHTGTFGPTCTCGCFSLAIIITVNIIQSTNQSTQTVVLFYSKSVLILEIKSKSENFNIGVRNSYSTALWLCALSNSWWVYCMGVSMVFLYLIVSTVLCLSNSPFSRIQCTPLDFSTLLRYVSLLFSGWFQLCILMSCHDLQNFTMDNTAGFW